MDEHMKTMRDSMSKVHGMMGGMDHEAPHLGKRYLSVG
jgi:hypothetical protein